MGVDSNNGLEQFRVAAHPKGFRSKCVWLRVF